MLENQHEDAAMDVGQTLALLFSTSAHEKQNWVACQATGTCETPMRITELMRINSEFTCKCIVLLAVLRLCMAQPLCDW